jgi:hypothetical protein
MAERKPQDVWKALVDEAREDDEIDATIREVEQMSAAEKAEALREAGIDPQAVSRTMEDLLAKHAERPAPEPAVPVRAVDRGSGPKARLAGAPSPWTRRRLLLAAAMLALVVVAFLAMGGGALIARFRTDEIGPDNERDPRRRPSPQQIAAQTREQALAACNAERFTECEQKLDAARQLDPAGEDDPRVRAARQDIDDFKHPERKKPTKGPGVP